VPNSCRMVVVASRSSLVGLMKIAASSAYIEVLHLAAARGSSTPELCSTTLQEIACGKCP
jgi:hypothetical protein